jgi:hypothetical protein
VSQSTSRNKGFGASWKYKRALPRGQENGVFPQHGGTISNVGLIRQSAHFEELSGKGNYNKQRRWYVTSSSMV